MTLISLRVTTLPACLHSIAKAGLVQPALLQHAVLWKLRQYLAAVAAGDPGFTASSCPAFDADWRPHGPSVAKVVMRHV